MQYCGITCQKKHRSKHKQACKKRAAELRDELLFTQPKSSHLGDCPICCLPLPLDSDKINSMFCCSQLLCGGCTHANMISKVEDHRGSSIEMKCLFCRQPSLSRSEFEWKAMKRVEVNDPVAMYHMALIRAKKGDYQGAFEYYSRGAALGNVAASYGLACMYRGEKGIEKDEKKMVFLLEEAAIGGHPDARYQLGFIEAQNGRNDRAVKHLMIASKLGHDRSIKRLREIYAETKGVVVKKDDLVAALQGYQAAIDAMKSSQRTEADKFLDSFLEVENDQVALKSLHQGFLDRYGVVRQKKQVQK